MYAKGKTCAMHIMLANSKVIKCNPTKLAATTSLSDVVCQSTAVSPNTILTTLQYSHIFNKKFDYIFQQYLGSNSTFTFQLCLAK